MKILSTILMLMCLSLSIAQNSHRDVIDVQHYEINMEVTDFNEFHIYGNTEITFETTASELATITFDFYKILVDSVFFNGAKIDNFSRNDTAVWFTPTQPVLNGETQACTIFYHGRPFAEPGLAWGGVHTGNSMVFNMGVAIQDSPHGFGRGWYPCIDNFTDRATYDINIITNNNHRAISTGLLTEVVDYGEDKKLWKWTFDQTSPTYLISFVVGNFTLNTRTFEGVNGDIPLEIYALQSDSMASVSTFADVPEMLSMFETKFGPYHWPKAGYTVVNFNSGAMEHLTNIAYPSYALSTSDVDQALVAHELSHHWFGNQVTCANAGDMWLNEGWASYCEALYMEHFKGDDAYANYVANNQKSVVNSAHLTDLGYWALSEIPDEYTYSTTVYDKGSMVVHNLRHYMGDEFFFPAVQSYLDVFSENHATSEQLRNHLTTQSGIDLTSFFDNWVFNGGFPQYMINSAIKNQNSVTVEISQNSIGRDFIANDNKFQIGVVDNEWNIHDFLMEFDGVSGSETFDLDFTPVMVIPDPNNKTADAVFDAKLVINSIGTKYFSGLNATLFVTEIVDSTLFFIAQAPRAGFETSVITNDIEPLDMINWYVDLDTKGSITGRTKFVYRTIGLDYLNLNATDSLVLIYRQDASHEWIIPEHGWYGSVGSGSFMLQTIMAGQYGVGRSHGGNAIMQLEENQGFIVWPNPSDDGFYYIVDHSGVAEILIYDVSGRVVDNIKCDSNVKEQYYSAKNIKQGQYYIQLNVDEKKVGSTKWVKN